jgi:adenosylcobinamide kinase/adenosylcobinamide-phosphate guanylyltransferase
MGLTFLIGGARSGKSALAVDLAERSELAVTFIATAPTPAQHDAEMLTRIERHRAERPRHWTTVEEPIDLAGALQQATDTFVIVDCLTLWVSNLLWEGRSDAAIDQLAVDAAALASSSAVPVVAVSNEVGMDVHPDTAVGRRYRDVLGRVNQRWSAAAHTSLLLVAGRAVRLDDPITALRCR